MLPAGPPIAEIFPDRRFRAYAAGFLSTSKTKFLGESAYSAAPIGNGTFDYINRWQA